MWSHARDHHEGQLGPDGGAGDYVLRVDGVFRDTMTRQVDEDTRMRLIDTNCVLMNGKNE